MPKQQQDGKKGNKKAGRNAAKCAQYRTYKAKQLRKRAATLVARGASPDNGMVRQLRDRAEEIASGVNKHHRKSRLRGPLAATQARIQALREAHLPWDLLPPGKDNELINKRGSLLGIVRVVTVSDEGYWRNNSRTPIVGTRPALIDGKWQLVDAPKSGIYEII